MVLPPAFLRGIGEFWRFGRILTYRTHEMRFIGMSANTGNQHRNAEQTQT